MADDFVTIKEPNGVLKKIANERATIGADEVYFQKVELVGPDGTKIIPATADPASDAAAVPVRVIQSAIPQPVSGTVDQGAPGASAWPVEGPLTDAELRAAAVPVSVAALPLPTGAATSTGVDAVAAAVAATQARTVTGSVAVTNLPATQAVSVVVLPLPAGAATSAAQTTAQTTLDALATEATVAATRDRLPVALGTGGGIKASLVDLGGAATEATLAARLPAAFTAGGGVKVGLVDELPAGTQALGSVLADLRVGALAVGSGNPVPVTGNVAVTGAELVVVEAIAQAGYDLAAAPYSQVTSIGGDYILDRIALKFSTTAARDIAITYTGGKPIFVESASTVLDLELEQIDEAVDAARQVTVSIGQTGGACAVDVLVVVKRGALPISGQTPVTIAGHDAVYYQGNATAAGVALGPLELGGKGFISLHSVSSAFVGSLVVEGTNDPAGLTGWVTQQIETESGASQTVIRNAGLAYAHVTTRHARVRCSAFTSGSLALNAMVSPQARPRFARSIKTADGLSAWTMSTFGVGITATETYLCGGDFDDVALDTTKWADLSAAGGSVTLAGGVAEVRTGVGAAGRGGVRSLRKANFLGGVDNVIKLRVAQGDTGGADHVFRFGVYDDDNGAFVEVGASGVTFKTRKAGVDTESPFGLLGLVAPTNSTASQFWDIVFNPAFVIFKQGANLVQLFVGSASLTPLFERYDLPVSAEAVNLSGSTDHVLYVQTAVALRLGEQATVRADEVFHDDDVLDGVSAVIQGRTPSDGLQQVGLTTQRDLRVGFNAVPDANNSVASASLAAYSGTPFVPVAGAALPAHGSDTWLGAWSPVANFSQFSLDALATAVGNGFAIWSTNGGTTVSRCETTPFVGAGAFSGPPQGSTHYCIAFQNITPAPSTFSLNALLRYGPQGLFMFPVGAPINASFPAGLVKAGITGIKSGTVAEFLDLSLVQSTNGGVTIQSIPVVSGARPSQVPGRTAVHFVADGVTGDALLHTVPVGKTFYMTHLTGYVQAATGTTVRAAVEDGVVAGGTVRHPIVVQGNTTSGSNNAGFLEPIPFTSGVYMNLASGSMVACLTFGGYEA